MEQAAVTPVLDPVFSVAEARAAGLTDYRLRSSRLASPSRGLRMWFGAEPDWLDYARALCQLEGDHCLSHVTAARLWGLWLPAWLEDDESVHVTGDKHTSGARRRPGVVGHRAKLHPDDVVEVAGLRLTSPARTWLDMAPQLRDPFDLVAAGDALVQRTDGPPRPDGVLGVNPQATFGEIDAALSRRRSVKGIQAARAARPLLRAGVDSAPESRMRMVVVSAGLPEPVVNPSLALGPGVRRQPDLALLEWQVALQYDGGGHAEQAQVNRDIWRDDDFDRHDWRTVRAGRDLYTAHGENAFLARLRRAMRDQERRGFGPRG